jgi:hypothetical protein
MEPCGKSIIDRLPINRGQDFEQGWVAIKQLVNSKSYPEDPISRLKMLRRRKQKHRINYGDEMDSIRLGRLRRTGLSLSLEDAIPLECSSFKLQTVILPIRGRESDRWFYDP